jgi:hypothetical protein
MCQQTNRERTMLKIFGAVLIATSVYAGAASARGGGPAEAMPATNFTDMPSYRPKSLDSPGWSKRLREHVRWHQNPVHAD